ncbi:hypothetical protein IBE11_04855 [Francisella tularensis subsp. novicida]|uniref:hypothetical protein n=1 Tax=Francisella TaxID=262 RepID=UPI0005003E75|nr:MULTISPECIES: hypothetical protein [Francisella]AJI45809.1 hypothetical protein AS84_1824 [Francisella tularensis subsp. novicida F6168]AJJ46710.1 hypothetical protein CH70_1329 [Francisella tularensis subsp. novicida]APC99070.1 hypothetical protein KX03_736 [Francisella tularensis subsp. novicida]KFJ68846.1 hypothetical protein DR83_1407 [Francisella tularensis subsp. novicida]MBK2344351.1 hypothetical protein [Francisella tularensis subsp. novicida]
MLILTFDGLLLSPLLLFVAIALILTILTNLIAPKLISKYTDIKLSWLNLALFLCYLGIVMFILGD